MFDKKPGLPPEADLPEGHAILLGDTSPEVVRLPSELGGEVVKVIKTYWRPCPVHVTHNVKCLELEGGVHVAECDQFYWFKPRD